MSHRSNYTTVLFWNTFQQDITKTPFADELGPIPHHGLETNLPWNAGRPSLPFHATGLQRKGGCPAIRLNKDDQAMGTSITSIA